jgi:hypothetical protein
MFKKTFVFPLYQKCDINSRAFKISFLQAFQVYPEEVQFTTERVVLKMNWIAQFGGNNFGNVSHLVLRKVEITNAGSKLIISIWVHLVTQIIAILASGILLLVLLVSISGSAWLHSAFLVSVLVITLFGSIVIGTWDVKRRLKRVIKQLSKGN